VRELRSVSQVGDDDPGGWVCAATQVPLLQKAGGLDRGVALVAGPDNADELFDEIDRLDVKTRGQSGIRVIGPTPSSLA
jgi:hypothetical protein